MYIYIGVHVYYSIRKLGLGLGLGLVWSSTGLLWNYAGVPGPATAPFSFVTFPLSDAL